MPGFGMPDMGDEVAPVSTAHAWFATLPER